MRSRCRDALLASVALALTLGGTAPAQADLFGPISLASVGMLEGASTVEQASVARHPVISGDGRYVAFEGWFGGVSGVWRRDLLTGAVEQVAGGDAQLPSISENGQYISFTTNEGGKLAEVTNGQAVSSGVLTHESPNVYVRDMAKPPSEPGAFVVASAASGSDQPLTYNEPSERFGSVASGRSAISADGRYVAFVTTAASDLVQTENDRRAEEKNEPPPAETPARQVAVRDLQTNQSQLVSVEYDNGPSERPVPSERGLGAVYEVTPFSPARPSSTPPSSSQGASISADGSTVAWIGQEIDRQAPVLASAETNPEYVEPLWRRIAGGASEPTRRITGGADPANPTCAASGETEPINPPTLSDPCQGPFEPLLPGDENGPPGVFSSKSGTTLLPQLSANGLTVAFLASQRLIAAGGEQHLASNDLYVVDMANGLTRVRALRRLTELGAEEPNVPGLFAPITDFSISPDGSQIAFTTERTAFPLGSPTYVTPPASKPEMQELFDVDLADDTLTRVTHGYQGETQQSEPASALAEQKEAGSPSFSADGSTLAFSSAATNLAYGEGNKASSVFVVSRERFEAEPVPQLISPAPPSPNTEPAWLLNASAHSRRDGSVLLEVEVPGAGSLSASAQSSVRVKVSRSRTARRGARSSQSVKRPTTTVASRRVASSAKRARGEGLVTLVLTLAPSYRALASERGGLSATVTVSFTAPGHRALRNGVPVTFLRSQPKRRPTKRPTKRRAGKARRRR
jgi:Tol biopolymer transport system component